ncbi:MAG: glutaredoxin domain-containing protein [Polyangiaceae bacterium]
MSFGSRIAVLLSALHLATAALGGCQRGRAPASMDSDGGSPVVRFETQGLLLTWIDDKGDFHVETRVADVPLMGRDTVRVEGEGGDYASPDRLFVVDLRQAQVDGTFPVRTMTRTAFEALAVARRSAHGTTLGTGSAPPSAAATGDFAATASPAARTVVVIYGAEWCGACHEAARYLRHKGIAYVEKDIEKDPAAAKEMQEKLAKHGLPAGSIPVIDVRGRVMVGFNAPDIDAALGDRL